ncbi:ribonucleoside-triphosphate reductase, adenosylcobalamin-dependent [Pyruvatibacter sp.]
MGAPYSKTRYDEAVDKTHNQPKPPSVRAQVITRRTYNRPLNDEGTEFETWEDTIDRVISHQQWLWERALGRPLDIKEDAELMNLRLLMLERKVSVSGRTLWLGGTDVAKTREASQFNCSFGRVETVHDVVDAFWLLLQGCGVGFTPVTGTLSGFSKPVVVHTLRSHNSDQKGREGNSAVVHDDTAGQTYHLQIGDSAEAWAKAIGKLLALKEPVDRIFLDYTQIRKAGIRLKGYGWISSGDETIHKAFEAICELLNKRAGKLLTRIDILDLLNHLGTTLSSRRSAEIAVVPYTDPEFEDFVTAKHEHWIDNPQRAQSNNSVLFYQRPSKLELKALFQMMVEAGGSEPGFINAEAALKRAPWFKGVNPCAEILLGNKSFCNLVEIDLGKFNHQHPDLLEAVRLVARANYRQTCVNLRDGILQDSWHELNEFLRLTGVGLTGIVRWEHHQSPDMLKELRGVAEDGAHSMADDLGLPRSKCVTTIKPSGTLSKIMDTTEGVHKPLGKYIFNNVRFSKHDPLVDKCREAGYRVFDDPYSDDSSLVTFPVAYDDVEFDEVDGKPVNQETAIGQLERYKLMMDNYVSHNCSVTISYSPEEVNEIVSWIYHNWDSYVGVSFIFRNDPTKTAADLGYPYLPQEVVTEDQYREYLTEITPLDINKANTLEELQDDECATGVCPIR